MTTQALLQVLASGLLMGLIYALIAVGLSLIFGLMDVVNFAHGEFLMTAMYVVFGLFLFTALDPVLFAPVAAAVLFCVGALAYLGIVRFAMRAKANQGMVQIFATFGLATLLQGAAQYFLTPDYRSIGNSWLGGKTLDLGGVFLPWPQMFGGLVSIAAFGGLYLLMSRTDFGKALEATREDQGAVALVGIDRNRVFALGWGLGAALVGLAGAVLAIFYYIHPQVGATFGLIAYVTVALGGFGSVFGALVAGVIVGLVEALTAAFLPPAMKSLGIFALYLGVVFIRPSGLFGKL
ncbi:branched-chain amino acid transport system permease protein [Bosea sp. OAE752]|jgi:branched-chain amino acid transport system permease protein|uniref:Branched-chain amino acid ABC transporter permease n=1 Tax=Bosea spartocytisi TaxID=2773451 RepID=A0A927ECM5_9HYPH|nr:MULTISPECIES: branched-chain amino acid ABC transporter permease [Bosea]MBD3846259.1 branched-chain amino acid ABC transporter permease [Bosea spartocytisi]MCT4473443.1 branched-chain amino acid ABC transporter permease [Bosea spartocytisi]